MSVRRFSECVAKSASTMGDLEDYKGVCTFHRILDDILNGNEVNAAVFRSPFSQLRVDEPPQDGCGNGWPSEFGAIVARQSIVAPAQFAEGFEQVVDAWSPSQLHVTRRDRFRRTCRDDDGNAITS